MIARAFTTVALLLLSAPAWAQAVPAPDDTKTPGVARTDMTEAQARKVKWGLDRRAVTEAMKTEVMERYGIESETDKSCGEPRCEIDHRIPRACLGADDVNNLYPQAAPYWHQKDRLESYEAKLFRTGKITAKQCQAVFLSDWRVEYQRVYGKAKVAGR